MDEIIFKKKIIYINTYLFCSIRYDMSDITNHTQIKCSSCKKLRISDLYGCKRNGETYKTCSLCRNKRNTTSAPNIAPVAPTSNIPRLIETYDSDSDSDSDCDSSVDVFFLRWSCRT